MAQQVESIWDVKIGNLQGLKAGGDESEMLCMQLNTADEAIDMIQGDFYERYNFYTDSCAISPSAFLLIYLFICTYTKHKTVHINRYMSNNKLFWIYWWSWGHCIFKDTCEYTVHFHCFRFVSLVQPTANFLQN